ncbi:hypothetical protein GOBAR_AA31024 [Gossypium barbadense]|uniref:Uncharacterized protein n=1 Tax=Gossypium barbadense TaxID=3634 RepID=A0A2P5WEZ3_GOSBA|nr:hypothetical protein GOBAR_AA31024 [Gossypium barbadense]
MLRYQWEDEVRFWNSKKGEDRERVGTSSRQKQKFTHTARSRSFASVAEAELFEIMHRKKDGSPMTSEAGEILEKLKEKKGSTKRLLRLIVLLILRTLITELSLKFWVLKEATEREAAAAAKEAATAAREAEAAAMVGEQSRKYDELQLQLQQMMQMFQQSQKPPS